MTLAQARTIIARIQHNPVTGRPYNIGDKVPMRTYSAEEVEAVRIVCLPSCSPFASEQEAIDDAQATE